MERHVFTERITDRGYTVRQICALMNRRGIRCKYEKLYQALRNKPNKTDRETFLAEQAIQTLESLPDLSTGTNELLDRMRENGISISDLFRYHNRTKKRTYCWRTYWLAVRAPIEPFQIRVRKEAEEDLDELIAERKAGLTS